MGKHHPEKRTLVALAGLPGTGKSTIASRLAERLPATVLSKDLIRLELFGREGTDFSREQDDLCMKVLYLMARVLMERDPELSIIIDGRTFSKKYQVEEFLSRAKAQQATPVLIECVCNDAAAKERLERDERAGTHPAANRTWRLYQELKQQAEPIVVPHLVIDTGREGLERCVEQCLAYLAEQRFTR